MSRLSPQKFCLIQLSKLEFRKQLFSPAPLVCTNQGPRDVARPLWWWFTDLSAILCYNFYYSNVKNALNFGVVLHYTFLRMWCLFWYQQDCRRRYDKKSFHLFALRNFRIIFWRNFFVWMLYCARAFKWGIVYHDNCTIQKLANEVLFAMITVPYKCFWMRYCLPW